MGNTEIERAVAEEILQYINRRYEGNPLYDTTWIEPIAEIIRRRLLAGRAVGGGE